LTDEFPEKSWTKLSVNTMLIADEQCSDICSDEFLVP